MLGYIEKYIYFYFKRGKFMHCVLYFNQWFSSIGNIIKRIKEINPSVYVIASSKNPDHVYKAFVDKFIVEERYANVDDYIDFVVNTCKENKVNLFFVKDKQLEIAKNRNKFDEIGTGLVLENYDTLEKLSSKADVYGRLGEVDFLKWLIPDYYISDKYHNTSYNWVLQSIENGTCCFKYDSDEGGMSFRRVGDTSLNIDTLRNQQCTVVSKEQVLNMIKSASIDQMSKVLFMETLDSPEISVDCYNSSKGFIAVCRCKEQRKQRIFYNELLYYICKEIANTYKFTGPFNVQFRFKHGSDTDSLTNIRLLEINPRMSGGLYYLASVGLDIAQAVLKDALDKQGIGTEIRDYNIDDFRNFKDKYVTYIEHAVVLQGKNREIDLVEVRNSGK